MAMTEPSQSFGPGAAPSGAAAALPPSETVRVWDPFVRLFHWSLVGLVAVSFATGDEFERMHIATGYGVAGLVVLRLVWGVFGSRHARFGDFVRVGVECEIAVRLARDLVPGEAPFTADSVTAAIDAYHPAIEIVDDRYVKWETAGAPTHLNFWVMTQDGVRHLIQGGLAQELNLATGLPVPGEPGVYQARLSMAQNMLYTVVVFSEGSHHLFDVCGVARVKPIGCFERHLRHVETFR